MTFVRRQHHSMMCLKRNQRLSSPPSATRSAGLGVGFRWVRRWGILGVGSMAIWGRSSGPRRGRRSGRRFSPVWARWSAASSVGRRVGCLAGCSGTARTLIPLPRSRPGRMGFQSVKSGTRRRRIILPGPCARILTASTRNLRGSAFMWAGVISVRCGMTAIIKTRRSKMSRWSISSKTPP
ncbi:hypothetical protein DOFOFD_07420 [Acetobacteraceae bacterium EV16P]|uniref:Uncharacterized protein n=1 Tax=Sorlinia euscelidii TaxID=3081148 RepID=A0ABU7U2V5_9PROT